MSSMLKARIKSQMESISNVLQHEHPFSGCLDDSQMLKTKMYVISPSMVLFQKIKKREMKQSPILTGFDSRLFGRDVLSRPEPPPRRTKGARNYIETLYMFFQTLVVLSLITESKYHIQDTK